MRQYNKVETLEPIVFEFVRRERKIVPNVKRKFMNMMKKPLALLGAFLLAGSVFAESEGDYIKTFGQLMYERNGMMELNLTPAELELFIQGMRDAQAGKPLPENIQQMGPKMFDYLRTRAEKNMKIAAEKSEAEAAAFWKELEKKSNVNKTPSGLAYEIVKEGDGKFPSENSDVKIKYTGKLINGKVFDSTDLHGGEPAEFNLSKVIPGFREGLQKISKGGKAILYIPAALAYKDQPNPEIPPNSTLIFDVELLDVKDGPAQPPAPVKAEAPKPAPEKK